MIRISRFFLPFLCCLTAPALAGTQTRWEVVPDSTAIVWNVREGDSHRDHIEMSGLRISAVLRYGVGATAVSGSNAVSCGRCCAPSRTIRTVR